MFKLYVLTYFIANHYSSTESSIHSSVIEFPTREEADTAYDILKGVLTNNVSWQIIKLYKENEIDLRVQIL